jgi:putative transcriptional regulator
LDSDLLKNVREERGISLGTLAESAGVSRRTIQMYESGMGAMIDAALRIEEFLGLPIIEPIDPFTFRSEERMREEYPEQSLQPSSALAQLSNLGFTVTQVVKSPFEAVTNDSHTVMLTGVGGDDNRLVQRAMVASELSKIIDRFSVIIVDRKSERDNINSTAVISTDELQRMDGTDALTDLVASRGTRK